MHFSPQLLTLPTWYCHHSKDDKLLYRFPVQIFFHKFVLTHENLMSWNISCSTVFLGVKGKYWLGWIDEMIYKLFIYLSNMHNLLLYSDIFDNALSEYCTHEVLN